MWSAFQHSKEEDQINLIDQNYLVPPLFISNFNASSDAKLLSALNISVVINASKIPKDGFVLDEYQTYNIREIYVDLDDEESASLIVQEMSNERKQCDLQCKGVLVHCRRGVSRSCALVIGLIMDRYKWTYETWFQYVRSKRVICSPNDRFIQQLKEREYEVKSSADLDADDSAREHDHIQVTF